MPDPLMKLPEGKTCADCLYSKKCVSMFGAKLENSYCDFYPVRFSQKTVEKDNAESH